MQELKIFNAFGITPTNTYVSAGTDYYVPNIDESNVTQVKYALMAFEKSYKVTKDDIDVLCNIFRFYDENKKFENQLTNIIHLYYALYSNTVENLKHDPHEAVKYFINNYLIFDANGVAGIKMKLNDTLFINSGIKIALPHGYAGVYLNKSGKGNAGFDVRAQVVDEDYSGYVHLSQAYTKDLLNEGQNIVYCGDKLVQMLIIPVLHTTPVEIPFGEYNELMSNTQRGDSGFGSSDVKH